MSLRLAEAVTVAETEYGAVLLHQRSGEYWQLNPTGQLVLSALLAGRGRDGALAEVLEAFGVEPAQAAADLDGLVAQLHEAGLVRP